MKNQHKSKRNRVSLSLDMLQQRYQNELERTFYQKKMPPISDIDQVWQRRNKSKDRLGQPVINKLVKANINRDENDKLYQHIKQKESQHLEKDTVKNEEFIQNILKFIENCLPSYSSTYSLKGQNKPMKVFSDEHKQIFWNPSTAHYEVNTFLKNQLLSEHSICMQNISKNK